MMGENPLLLNRASLLIDKVPISVYEEYFNALKLNGNLYTAVVIGEDQTPGLFIEDCKTSRICRIFFREKDAIKYSAIVESSDKMNDFPVKVWRAEASTIATLLIKLESMSADKNKQLQGLASYFIKHDIKTIDLFWTKNSKIIN